MIEWETRIDGEGPLRRQKTSMKRVVTEIAFLVGLTVASFALARRLKERA